MVEALIGILIGGIIAFGLCMAFHKIAEYGEKHGIVQKKK